MSGFLDLFTYQRVQILGNTENHYLAHLSAPERHSAFQNLIQFDLPCIVLTEDNELEADMIMLATQAGIPLYRTPCRRPSSWPSCATFCLTNLRRSRLSMARWWRSMEWGYC